MTELQVEVWPFPGYQLVFPQLEGMPSEDAARAVLAEVPGGSAVGVWDRAVRDRLLAAGASQRRHVLTMRRDLASAPAPELPGVVLRPWQDDDAELLARAYLGAYHADHPDAATPDQDDARMRLEAAVSDPHNPLLRATTVAESDGRPVGAAVVQRSQHVTAWKGPWIIDVFRAPAAALRGVGPAMLLRAVDLLREDGESHLGLAVTATNPARRVYERLGFSYDSEGWVLALPGGAPSQA